jgi:hypothetical protein
VSVVSDKGRSLLDFAQYLPKDQTATQEPAFSWKAPGVYASQKNPTRLQPRNPGVRPSDQLGTAPFQTHIRGRVLADRESVQGPGGDGRKFLSPQIPSAAAPQEKFSTSFQGFSQARRQKPRNCAICGGIGRAEIGPDRSDRGKRRFLPGFPRFLSDHRLVLTVFITHGSLSPVPTKTGRNIFLFVALQVFERLMVFGLGSSSWNVVGPFRD